jgi:hypothetical protein
MKQKTTKLIALVAEACEAAYRRGYQQAAFESDRIGFTSADLDALYRWRFMSPNSQAKPPLRNGWSCTAVERLKMERPELLELLEDTEEGNPKSRKPPKISG